MQTKEVLSAEEAAQLLGVKPWTVREEARNGHLPGRKIGKEWRFSRRALLDWLREEEPLSPGDLAAVQDGIAALRRGEYVTLEEYERERGV